MSPVNPKISVVMPAYNHEKYIGEAIESVLRQSCRDFELIIVNDGSTDGTEAAILKFQDPRIVYHFQENADAFNAINKGIALAGGDLIAIINSDDVYHPDRLEKMAAAMAASDAVFAFSDLHLIDSWSRRVDQPNHPLMIMTQELKRVLKESGSLKQTLLSGNLAITTSNFVFARELVDSMGSFSPYRYAHDYDFILRALSRFEKRVLYCSEPLVSYRVHSNNTITENPARVDIETFRILLQHLPSLVSSPEDRLVVDAFKGQVDRMSYVMNDADAMMAKVFNTVSWKVTAPLRYLGEILGRRPK